MGNSTGADIDGSSLVDPATKEAQLALAFYRDGLSLQHTAFQFLSFYKVLNIQLEKGREQRAWINANYSRVSGDVARNRRDELLSSQPELGQYLFVSGRCAVAHSFNEPLVDPDNFEDDMRLRSDLPLIRELAAIRMQNDFGIGAPRRAV